MLSLIQMPFIQNALLGILPISLLCGIVGCLISINRLSYVAGALTHGAYGGVGLGVYFGLPILLSASFFSLVLALVMAYLISRYRTHSDNFIGAIWAFGMAIGIILIELSDGYKADMMGYLFGNILLITTQNLYIMAILALVFSLLLFFFFPQFQALSYDEDFAKTRGIASQKFFFTMMIMIAFCITASMQAVGLILVIALLSIPPFIAQNLSQTLKGMMILSVIFNCLFCFVGLIFSFYFNLSSGASIILTSVAGFVLYLGITKLTKLRCDS
ncbi:hypothetical protein BBW65_04725 [Helicobacter enhydrae]|uniref:Metal ABC transporter permease n=1 Tax=Helicobacter enhydrae TaxID=222136 RepID=A0A1B1U7N9_9HELI|nr:iron chelate uptake ABC transporter family permease subunit [Helicobacter enhydrae]ANV98766.1 hypothetical protein BBW65_04725 [Helicobacter enhydrae]